MFRVSAKQLFIYGKVEINASFGIQIRTGKSNFPTTQALFREHIWSLKSAQKNNRYVKGTLIQSDVQELVAQEKAQQASNANDEVDLDELMDDPELEKLHADRIASLKKEAEKRQALKHKGHGEYREISEGDFLGEVTGSERVACHFFHHEFYRCKIMDKHLKSLAPVHVSTKFIKLDAENAPFFVAKLSVKTLPCVILFKNGIATDRLIGFQDLGSKDDFTTRALESLLIKKGAIDPRKNCHDEEDGDESDGNGKTRSRSVRSSTICDSDSE